MSRHVRRGSSLVGLLALLCVGTWLLSSTVRAQQRSDRPLVSLNGSSWVEAGDELSVFARAWQLPSDEPVWLIPAVSQPTCELQGGGTVLSPGDTVAHNSSVEALLAFRCTGPQRLGVGAVAFGEQRGPLANEFLITTVVGKEFSHSAIGINVILVVAGCALGVLGNRLPRVVEPPVAIVAAFASIPALAVDMPLHSLSWPSLTALTLVPAALLLLSATGLRTAKAIPGVLLVGVVVLGLDRLLAFLWIVIALGTIVLRMVDAGRDRSRIPLRVSADVALVASIALGVFALRPFTFEVLAWSLYGGEMNVVPFQRA